MRARLLPGGGNKPFPESGRFGKHAGTGRSKFKAPSLWTVITNGSSNPGGNGPGNRSGGTGAMPTRPPRVPLSLKSALAGTLISTPASAGFAATTSTGKVTFVSCAVLTG
jgi:hypothetical protein